MILFLLFSSFNNAFSVSIFFIPNIYNLRRLRITPLLSRTTATCICVHIINLIERLNLFYELKFGTEPESNRSLLAKSMTKSLGCILAMKINFFSSSFEYPNILDHRLFVSK